MQIFLAHLKRETTFKDGRPGRHGCKDFQRRHPEEDLGGCFSETGSNLDRKNLRNREPSRIFDCREINVLLCPRPENVLTEKAARSVYKVLTVHKHLL